MNIFVIVAIIILACLACIGLALWYRKRTKMEFVQKLKEHNADMNEEQQDSDGFNPDRYGPS